MIYAPTSQPSARFTAGERVRSGMVVHFTNWCETDRCWRYVLQGWNGQWSGVYTDRELWQTDKDLCSNSLMVMWFDRLLDCELLDRYEFRSGFRSKLTQ